MSDLKAVYDRVLAAQAERDLIVNEIENEMAKGTPESDQKALELGQKLDEAQKKVTDLEGMYNNMQVIAKAGKINAQFVPVSNTTNEAVQEEKGPKVLNMADYNKLSPRERLEFAKSGGKLEE
jgi:hypothetical protein